MKRVKNLALATGFASVVLALSTIGMASASNYVTRLQCDYPEIYLEQNVGTVGCDMAIAKQVSVNDGAYNDADTLDQAAQATVGDTITWKITVTNTSEEGYTPRGAITVHDVLPAGFTLSSATPSTGTYSGGDWNFVAEDNLPATLVISGIATTAGSMENTATFTGYNTCESDCEDPPYVDSNSTNNTNSAFVQVSAKQQPVVTPVSTPAAPHTGFGVRLANAWLPLASFGLLAVVMLAAARTARRYATTR